MGNRSPQHGIGGEEPKGRESAPYNPKTLLLRDCFLKLPVLHNNLNLEIKKNHIFNWRYFMKKIRMLRRLLGLFLLLFMAVPNGAFPDTYTFTSFSYPGSLEEYLTYATDINDSGQIVGRLDGSGQSFLTEDGVNFSIITYPLNNSPINTTLTGINNLGQIVGHYSYESWRYNFLKDGESYSLICPGYRFSVNRMNDSRQIVGHYGVYDSRVQGVRAFGALWDGVPSLFQ